MITRFFLIIFFSFYSVLNCSAPKKPDTELIIRTGDNLIKDVEALEKKYKKDPASVTYKEVQDLSNRIKTQWPLFKKALLDSDKYGSYWKKQYESNEWLASIGKWLIGIIVLIIVSFLVYSGIKVYFKFSDPLKIIE
jgi:hypothetical protein